MQNTGVTRVRDLPFTGARRRRSRSSLPAAAGGIFAICTSGLVLVLLASGVAAQGAGTVWDGVYTEEQARRGGGLYQMHCAACHGDTLAGGEAAPALVGATFNSTWDGVTLGDLFDRIRATMPQNQPGTLSRAQNADVIAFLLASGKFPAGDKVFEPQSMGGITFRSYRP